MVSSVAFFIPMYITVINFVSDLVAEINKTYATSLFLGGASFIASSLCMMYPTVQRFKAKRLVSIGHKFLSTHTMIRIALRLKAISRQVKGA